MGTLGHLTTPLEIKGDVLGQVEVQVSGQANNLEVLQMFIKYLLEDRPEGRVEKERPGGGSVSALSSCSMEWQCSSGLWPDPV